MTDPKTRATQNRQRPPTNPWITLAVLGVLIVAVVFLVLLGPLAALIEIALVLILVPINWLINRHHAARKQTLQSKLCPQCMQLLQGEFPLTCTSCNRRWWSNGTYDRPPENEESL